MRKPGWYWVKYGEANDWECKRCLPDGRWASHDGVMTFEPSEIGPHIPTPDEPWQVVPKEITAEGGYKTALIGEFSEKHSDRCPECEAMGDEEECIICLGTGEVENRIPVSWANIKAIHRRIVEISDVQSTREEEA